MSKVDELRQRHAEKMDEARELHEDGDLDPAEQREFKALMDAASELKERIKEAEEDREAKRREIAAELEPEEEEQTMSSERAVAFDPSGEKVRGFGPGESIYEQRKQERGWESFWDDVTLEGYLMARDVTGPRTDAEKRALNAGDVGLPDPLQARFIDTLREGSLTDRLGMQTFDMESDTLRVVRVDGDVSGSWSSEGSTSFGSTDANLTTVTLQSETRRGKLEIGRETFDDSVGIEDGIRRSFRSFLIRGLNDAVLKGSGSGNEPLGIANSTEINATDFGSTSGERPASTGTQWDAVLQARQALLDREVNAEAVRAVTSPKAHRLLESMTDANNQPLRRPRSLQDLEIEESVSSPTTLASTNGNAGMELTLGDFSGMAVGLRLDPEVRIVDASLADNWSLTMVGAARWGTAFTRPESIQRLRPITT